MSLLKKCLKCGKYTLFSECKKCGIETSPAHYKFIRIRDAPKVVNPQAVRKKSRN